MEDLDELRQEVYVQLNDPARSGKYPWFQGVESIPSGLELPEAFYLWMRAVDDVIDGDSDLPESCQSVVDYIRSKIQFLSDLEKPVDREERVISALITQTRMNIDYNAGKILQESAQKLLSALEFDVLRNQDYLETGQVKTFPGAELNKYLLEMELYSIARGGLVLLGEDSGKIDLLKPIVTVARGNHYFLRDLPQDLNDGRLNIPSEKLGAGDLALLQDACKIHGGFLGKDEKRDRAFFSTIPDSVRRWASEQIADGLKLVNKREENNFLSDFKVETRGLVYLFYLRYAGVFFEKIGRLVK